jgi:2-keto-3-deoxy-6-phosphogluconate aldolase
VTGVDGLFLGVDVGTSAIRVSAGGEVLASMRTGADAIKLFPAGSVPHQRGVRAAPVTPAADP